MICMALLALVFLASCRGPRTNANVYSSTVKVSSQDWYWDNTSWRVDLKYDAIDISVNDYGAVLVYMDNGNTWRQIPMTYYYSVVDHGQTVYCSSSLEVSSYLEGVSIFWTENDFYNQYRPEDHYFKIVALSSVDFESRSDVDYSNYEAVKEAFQIKEIEK